jgi:ABC-type transport system involved in multi-copper enzyme maturation permease subunit
MDRLLVILRHTFRESVVQPIYSLLIALGAAIVLIFALLPFFTLGEDTIMFKAVSLDVILLLALIATLFAASRSIYEEIEDRTMLTLMSKPVKKWQVLVGKYLGIILAALLAVAILGLILCLCTWYRVPADYRINVHSLDDRELKQLFDYRWMHIAGLVPSLFLIWMQISVLAAISVAISTRVSLVVNLPVVILLYIAGNLTRFLFPLSAPGAPLADSSGLVKGLAWVVSLILPYLEAFDLRQLTVYRPIKWAGSMFSGDPNAVSQSVIWGYVGIALLYAIAYSVCALAVGMWSFHNRELGGAEG